MNAYYTLSNNVDPECFFDEKCTWNLAINEIHERERYDFLEYISALDDEGRIHIKSSTSFESLRQQILQFRNSQDYIVTLRRIASKYAKSCSLDFLYYNYDQRGNVLSITEHKLISRIIFDIYNDNSNLLLISPDQFEEVVAELLRAEKFHITMTGKMRSKSHDILAVQTISGFPVKFLVECKRYLDRPVGLSYLRSFRDVITMEQANKGIMITSSWFTKGCWERQQQESYLLDLREKKDILNWIEAYCKRYKN
jgi:hypothetical protein